MASKVLWNDISLKAKQQFVSLLTIAEVEETILRFQQLVNDGVTELGCVPCETAGKSFSCQCCAYKIMKRECTLGVREARTFCTQIHVGHCAEENAFMGLDLRQNRGYIRDFAGRQHIRAAKHFCRAVIKHWKELLAIRTGMSKNDLAKHKRAAKRIVKGA